MAVGHDTELIAIGYMPAVIAGVLLILRGKYLGGTALMTLFFTLEVSIQHLQIVYYTGLIIGFIVICYLIQFGKRKKMETFYYRLFPDWIFPAHRFIELCIHADADKGTGFRNHAGRKVPAYSKGCKK